MKILGLTEKEFSRRLQGDMGDTWSGDWRAREVAFNRRESGAVVIASLPGSHRGIKDTMLGGACEIWLFPDGTYHARLIGNWIHSPNKGKAYKRTLLVRDGCYLHPTCETCPFPDCEISDIQAETSGRVVGKVTLGG